MAHLISPDVRVAVESRNLPWLLEFWTLNATSLPYDTVMNALRTDYRFSVTMDYVHGALISLGEEQMTPEQMMESLKRSAFSLRGYDLMA